MARPDGVIQVVHHRDFYLRGGDMTVQVENHLYRIHSFFFHRESPFFRQKFNDSDAGVGEERGSTDQNAYRLEDVTSEDFARFLWVFYNPKYSVYDAPLEAWLKIIRLADRWAFDNVKELSVRELEKIEMDPVEKIAIYQDNKISRLYLVPSYIAVCKRDQPLTLSEANGLGMETVVRLAEGRERLRQQAFGRGIRSPTSEDFDDAGVETLVREIFHLGPRRSAPAPAISTTTPAPVTSTNSTSHSAVRADPTTPANSPRANGTSSARANGAWGMEPRGSSLDSSPASTPASASTIVPPNTGASGNTNGRTNGSNTSNGHASNATNNSTGTTSAASTANGHTSVANGRAASASTSASTSSSVTGSKVSGSGLNKINFPNTTFRQAKEQLKGGSGAAGGK